jgi:hypothetical protein
MEAQGERRCSSYSFTISALDEGEWSASRPGRALLPGKGHPVPITYGGTPAENLRTLSLDWIWLLILLSEIKQYVTTRKWAAFNCGKEILTNIVGKCIFFCSREISFNTLLEVLKFECILWFLLKYFVPLTTRKRSENTSDVELLISLLSWCGC